MKRIYVSRSSLTLCLLAIFSFFGGGNCVKAQQLQEIFTETFEGFTFNGTEWSASSTEIKTADFNKKTTNQGWTVAKAFAGLKCVKFGGSSGGGSVITPELKHEGDAILTFEAGSWNNDNTTLTLSVQNGGSLSIVKKNDVSLEEGASSIQLTNKVWDTYTVALTGLSATSQIKITGTKRFFLKNIKVFADTSSPITYAAPKFDLEAGSYVIGQRLNITSSEGTNIVYSVNGGAEVTAATNAVGYRFPAPGEYKVKAKAVPAAADDENKESAWTEDITYNITENIQAAGAGNLVEIWKEDFTGMTDATKPANYTFKNGGTNTKLYNENLATGVAPELLVSKGGGVFTVVLDDLKGCSGEMTLTFKSNNGNCTVATTTQGCKVSGYSFANNVASCTVTVPEGTASLTLTFTNTKSGNTRVDDFLLTAEGKGSSEGDYYPLVLGALGISTFAAAQPYVMPDGMQGGIVTVDEAKGEATVTYLYKAGDVVPAREALVLKGTAGTEYGLVLTAEEGVRAEENRLRPALTYDRIDAEAGTKSYIFANDADRGLGFYFQGRDGDGSGVEGIYGKAYLSVTATAAVRGFVLKDGEATGIGEAAIDALRTARRGVYTIAGVRVGATAEGLPAGLYIVDGRKVLVK